MVQVGEHESLKAGIHGAICGLAAVCTVYNVWAFCVRREPHLAVNGLVYLALTAFEQKKVTSHVRRTA